MSRRSPRSLLAEGIQAGEIGDAVLAASLAQSAELWRLRELMSEVQKFEGGSIKHDVAVPVAKRAGVHRPRGPIGRADGARARARCRSAISATATSTTM